MFFPLQLIFSKVVYVYVTGNRHPIPTDRVPAIIYINNSLAPKRTPKPSVPNPALTLTPYPIPDPTLTLSF